MSLPAYGSWTAAQWAMYHAHSRLTTDFRRKAGERIRRLLTAGVTDVEIEIDTAIAYEWTVENWNPARGKFSTAFFMRAYSGLRKLEYKHFRRLELRREIYDQLPTSPETEHSDVPDDATPRSPNRGRWVYSQSADGAEQVEEIDAAC